jgi:tRNA-modifying protein YgfZ
VEFCQKMGAYNYVLRNEFIAAAGLTSCPPHLSCYTMETNKSRSGRLTHLGLLRFAGPDALNFLQGQISNDTQRLTPTSVLLAAYLNPQGRVLAVMHLLPHSSGTLAILPRELLQPTAERMRKYVLRAKVKIDEPGESLVLSGYHSVDALRQAGLPVPAEGSAYVERDGVGVAKLGHDARHWVVAAANAQLEATEATEAAGIERDWRLADVQAGLPQVYGATSEAFVAQMLNLDLLDGISFNKGCYTGQEIVARTQHLGRIKRRLFHLRLPSGSWRIGDEILLQDGRRGRLAEAIAGESGSEALAVLTLEPQAAPEAGAADAAPAAAATAAEQVPLPYALA